MPTKPNREPDNMNPRLADPMATLAHHDAQISALGGRMTGVENQMRTLQGEVHTGFAAVQSSMNSQIGSLASKLDKLDATPKIDFHKTVATITTIAVLFSMIVGGIIYITTGQFAGAWSRQDAFNTHMTSRVENLESQTQKVLGWAPVTEPARNKR